MMLTTLFPLPPLLVTAQYSGNITTENKGSCPIPLQSGDHMRFFWSPHAGDTCLEIPQEPYYSKSYHASVVGYAEMPDAKAPLYFGACYDDTCKQCTLVDVQMRTDRPGTIESACVELRGERFLFVGGVERGGL
ncbi:hypothetical protein BJX64DRAFT_284111 [Aspergillus heterothallicus]